MEAQNEQGEQLSKKKKLHIVHNRQVKHKLSNVTYVKKRLMEEDNLSEM